MKTKLIEKTYFLRQNGYWCLCHLITIEYRAERKICRRIRRAIDVYTTNSIKPKMLFASANEVERVSNRKEWTIPTKI